MESTWMIATAVATAVYFTIFGYFAVRGSRPGGWLAIALGNMVYVLLNLAAPFRGVMDPAYVGYRVGLFDVAPGFGVTLAAGLIVIVGLGAACIAASGGYGLRMRLLAGAEVFLLATIGLPETYSVVTNLNAYAIELGEYVRIPGLLAGLIVILLLVAPLVYGLLWSIRRIGLSAPEAAVA